MHNLHIHVRLHIRSNGQLLFIAIHLSMSLLRATKLRCAWEYWDPMSLMGFPWEWKWQWLYYGYVNEKRSGNKSMGIGMMLCAHSNVDHSSLCTTVRVFLNCSWFSGNVNGREPELLFGNKWELKYSIRFPKAGNGNKVMGMGGNGYTKVIPAYLYNAPVSVYWATLIQKSWPSSHSLAGGGRVRHDRRWSPSDVEQIEHRIDSPTSQSWFITHCRLISVVRGEHEPC